MKTLDIQTLPLQGTHLIEASAGTGKTYNIVQIYLRLLLEKKYRVEHILVMSFTRAATAELKSRIAQQLESLFEKSAHQKDSFRLLLRRALLSLDIAPIQTLDAFCHKILSQQGYHFQVEEDLTDIYLQSIRDYYRCHKDSPILFLCPDPDQFWQNYASLLLAPHHLADPKMDENYLKQAIQSDQEAIQSIWIDAFKSNKKKAEQKKHWQNIQAWLAGVQSEWPKSLPLFFKTSPPKMSIAPSLKKIRHMVIHIDKYKAQLKSEYSIHQHIITAVQEICSRVEKEKKRQKRLSFDDLIRRLAADLKKNPHLVRSLYKQYPVALIDEFQDTNQDQFAIIERIYLEHPQSTLYLIGDPKQSIYGFRGGDVFAYLHARQKVDHIWSMDKNWRSSPALLAAYHDLFQQKKGVFGPNIDYHPVQAACQDQWIEDPQGNHPLVFLDIEPQDNINQWRNQIGLHCAAEIHRLLHQVKINGQAIQPRDIVILVRKKREVPFIESNLKKFGISSVYLSKQDDLLQSQQAEQLLTALSGILEPENEDLFRAALSSPFLGSDFELIAGLNQDISLWENWYQRLVKLRDDWYQHGIMSMGLQLLHHYYQPPKNERERALTNSVHLLEILQEYSRAHHAQPMQLLRWFKQKMQLGSKISELRLESEENLIRIQTQHGAKGLQYPIVLIPFACFSPTAKRSKQTIFYYHDQKDRLIRQFGQSLTAQDRAEQESIWEENRLFYVAVTRAINRCYIALAEPKQSEQSPLAQFFNPLHQIKDWIKKQPQAIIKKNPIQIPAAPKQYTGLKNQAPAQWPPRFKPACTHIHSFSSLNRSIASSPPSLSKIDSSGLLRFALPAGIQTGHLLHRILEHADFGQAHWDKWIQSPLSQYGELPAGFDQNDLIDWLDEIVHTPLSPGLCLADLKSAQTLRELSFYYPIDPQSWQWRLKQYGVQCDFFTEDMMHGYIDLVFEYQGRFYIADYKSNWLGNNFADYQKESIAQNIEAHHYRLQSLIYSFALHRYLKNRLPQYDFDRHFGGVYYLYLRGMHPDHRSGVYFQSWDRHWINALEKCNPS